jgi:putative ABC transport system permease protein
MVVKNPESGAPDMLGRQESGASDMQGRQESGAPDMQGRQESGASVLCGCQESPPRGQQFLLKPVTTSVIPSFPVTTKSTPMLRNYIVIALRLLVKNKVFSLINILGLSTGIACCILITLFIQDEFNYEKGFPERHKVFRINSAFVKDGGTERSPYTSPAIGFGLQHALPGVEHATRVVKFLGVDQHIVRYKDKTFFEKRAYLVDSTFLDVFPFKLNEGNAATALDAPSSALISEELSGRIFGKESPLDELLIINSGQSIDTFRITGVVATPKYPSHIDADLYLSMNSNGLGSWILQQTTWANNNFVGGYLKLQDRQDYKTLEAKFAEQLDIHAGEELKASGRQKVLSLQPLDDIRLYSNFTRPDDQSSSITYVYMIGTIGIFILLLACINFMNLTTAKSAQRASEVGVRKSMGAYRGNLVRQFLGESMVIVVFALLVSFLMVMLVLPTFNSVMQKELSLNVNNLPFIIIAATLICLFTGVLAGSYPAFFLSSLRPTQVLKGKSLIGDRSQWLRKGLVVFQFVITITLISSIVIIQKQLRFIQSKSLGYDTEQVIMVPLRTPTALQSYSTLKSEFERIGGVKLVSGASSIPSTPLFSDWPLYKQGSSNDNSMQHENVWVDVDYFDALNIPFVAGRDFLDNQDNLPGDTINPWKIIVNEASLKALGIPLNDAVGASVFFEPGPGVRYEYHIVGVVKDFHQFSLHRQITPMTLILPPQRNFQYIAVQVRLDEYQSIHEKMKIVWDERINDIPFESIFLNESIKTLYTEEARMSTMLTISTVIALIISCLGLYGLSIYVAERKTKEIGIRKVVGASVQSIVGMLSKEYIILIIISFVIAIPLGYYMMDKWLEGFAYKIDPGINVFLISGGLAFSIAWLTISFESFRAARRNPVDTLRGE